MIDVMMIGGSGLVGKKAAARLAVREDVRLLSFVRRMTRAGYERQLSFEGLIHDGREALGIERANVAVSCLGSAIKQAGSKGAFRRVDYDYVYAFAQAALRLGFERLDVIRPGLLLGTRRELRLAERLAGYAMPLLHPFLRGANARYRATKSDAVALAIADLVGAEAPGRFLYENPQLEMLE